MPVGILELGQILVEELNLDPGVDTLGRWMAHYVASLIKEAESEQAPKLKQERSKGAQEAIKSLWMHRSIYENRINPLADLKPIVQALRNLDPSNNVYVLRNEGTGYVYDIFRRLIICLLLRKAESASRVSGAIARAKSTSKFQNDDERALIEALEVWLGDTLTKEMPEARRSSSKLPEVKTVNLDNTAHGLIGEARKALDYLESEIERTGEKRNSNSKG